MDFFSAIRTMSKVSATDNFRIIKLNNIISSIITKEDYISVWTPTLEILDTDLAVLDCLELVVVDSFGNERFNEVLRRLREQLSWDFDVKVKVKKGPDKRPLIELWSPTPREEFYMVSDQRIVQPGETALVPFDYLVEVLQPYVLGITTTTSTDNNIPPHSIDSRQAEKLQEIFPYVIYTAPPVGDCK